MEPAACDCGADDRAKASGFPFSCHEIGCAFLKWKVTQKQAGFCPQCNVTITIERDGDLRYCPNGCFTERSNEAALEVFDAAGSGWIRDAIK